MMVALQVHSKLSKDRNCGFHYFANHDEVHVTAKRFVHVLWPDVYHEVFGLKRRSLVHNRLRQSLSPSHVPKPAGLEKPKLESKASQMSILNNACGDISSPKNSSAYRPKVSSKELRLQAASSTVTKSSTVSSFNPGSGL